MIADIVHEVPVPIYTILAILAGSAVIGSLYILIKGYEVERPGCVLSFIGYTVVVLSVLAIAAVDNITLAIIFGIGSGLMLTAVGHWLRLVGDVGEWFNDV
jgi:hypothetical protein